MLQKSKGVIMTIDLPKEVENFVISEADKENISHSELIQRALARFAEEKRIQNYKNDIELIKQGKMKMLSAEEVFGNVRKRLKESRKK